MTTSSNNDPQEEALELIENIDGNDALVVLEAVADTDPDIAKVITRTATTYLEGVDGKTVESRVYCDLNSIQVETVWDEAGETRRGYVEPREKAAELFGEALQPHRERMEMFAELSMAEEAKTYCIGILAGLHRFEEESTSEYKDWAVDVPRQYFDRVMDQWRETCERPEDVDDVETYVNKNVPGWL